MASAHGMVHRSLAALLVLIASATVLAACSGSSDPTPEATATPVATEPPTVIPSAATGTQAPTVTSEAKPSPTPLPASTPESAVPINFPTAEMSALEATLTAIASASRVAGEFAFAVTDIQTSETVGVNIERPHLTGCTVNYFVLLQATIDAQEGRVAEDVVGDLIAATIRTSNPVTARELYGIAGDGDVLDGVERVAELLDELSGDDAVFDHLPLFGNHSRGGDRNNWISAVAMNEALRASYADGILDDEWRSYLLEKMTGVKGGLNYLLAVGPDVPVSRKNGFFPTDGGKWVDNDIGFVRFEQDGEERVYAVSFFSQWVEVKYDDIPLGQRLSTATWEFFQERYPSPDFVAASDTDSDSGS